MATINELSAIDAVAAGDLLAVYDASNSDARKASLSTLLTFIQSNLTAERPAYATQYSAPSATGFSVQITNGAASVHLILTPVATYANGTIVLPAVGNAIDKQEVLVNCTQVVTALAITAAGMTVTGAPTALAANGYFLLKYDTITLTWYRVG